MGKPIKQKPLSPDEKKKIDKLLFDSTHSPEDKTKSTKVSSSTKKSPQSSTDKTESKPKEKSNFFVAKQETKDTVMNLSKEHGNDKLLEMAKQKGVTWSEHSHKGINIMRAKMAIAQAMEEGKWDSKDTQESSKGESKPTKNEYTYTTSSGKSRTLKTLEGLSKKSSREIIDEIGVNSGVAIKAKSIEDAVSQFNKIQKNNRGNRDFYQLSKKKNGSISSFTANNKRIINNKTGKGIYASFEVNVHSIGNGMFEIKEKDPYGGYTHD